MANEQYINTATVNNDWKGQNLKNQGKKFEQCIHFKCIDGRFYVYMGEERNSNLIGTAGNKREAKKGARAWFNSL